MSPASMDRSLQEVDPEIATLIREETRRQAEGLELIASENFVSEAVLEAQGSTLTNKYAEGLPGKRYYGGCEVVDKVEQLAIDRAKTLFGAEHANVQPHAGSQANMATYFALLRPGDRIMSLSLAQGGHLTHGSPVNFSGKLFEIHHYGLDPKTERIDFDAARKQAREVRPRAFLCGASAYPRTLEFVKLREIAEEVGAMLICDIAHIAGMVAVGLHPSPIPLADAVTTTTHKTLRGPRSGSHRGRTAPGGRRHRHAPGALRSAPEKAHRQGGGGGAAEGGHHHQQEHDPRRSGEALRDQRPAAGHARA